LEDLTDAEQRQAKVDLTVAHDEVADADVTQAR
jgi:hypothetical protein